MNEQRFVVTNVSWRRLEPHLRGETSDSGMTAKDNSLWVMPSCEGSLLGIASGVSVYRKRDDCIAIRSL